MEEVFGAIVDKDILDMVIKGVKGLKCFSG